MTPYGVQTVARQEFRLRIRAGRWKALLIAWFALLTVLTVLLTFAARSVEGLDDDGTVVYGGLVLLVLGLALLVVPALAAQSVNGDRDRGTLASLQVTRLSPGDITLGKFVASWGTALLFLALTLPLAVFATTLGGVSLGRLLSVTAVVALLLGTVSAISLWLSAALSRTTTSGLLAYLAVAVLTIGTAVTWGLVTAVTQESVTMSSVDCGSEQGFQAYSRNPAGPLPPGCQSTPYQTTRARTDRTWFLLAPNPFVVVADAAPRLPDTNPPDLTPREQRNQDQARQLDVLGQLGNAVRGLRRAPSDQQGFINGSSLMTFGPESVAQPGAVWPYGLAFDVALAAGLLVLTTRRLRTPSRALPRGQRVA